MTNNGAGAATLTVGVTGDSDTFFGTIADGIAPVGLTVAGNGETQTLQGSMTYSGATTIDASATLLLGTEDGLSSNSDVTDNGTLELNGFDAIIGSLGGSSSGVVTNGFLNITLTVGNTGHSDTFAGSISQDSYGFGGNLALEVLGTGTIQTLSGNSSYSGITTIDAGGTLAVGATDGLSSSSDVTDNGTLDLNGFDAIIGSLGGGSTGIVTNNGTANGTLTVGATGTSATFSGTIADGGGTVGLTVDGTGTVETLGGSNSYSGPTTIDAGGTLTAGASTGLSSNSDVTDNGTLDLGGFGATIGSLGGSSTGLVTNSGAGAVTFTVGATGHSDTFTGTIADGSSAIGLTIDGTGAVETLSGSNSYSGTTTITAGTIQLGSNTGIPTGSTVIDDGTLDLSGFNPTIGSLSGSGTGTVSSSVGGPASLTITGSGSFSGDIQNGSGTVSLTISGSGVTETLNGTDTYGGTTTIDTGGTLLDGSPTALSGTSDITDNGTLDLGGFSATIGALGGSGTVSSSAAGSVTLTVGNTGDGDTFSGTIDNGSGTVGLSKIGGGTEIITGTSNTNTGATLVSAGTLDVNGTLDSNVTVSGTGTLTGDGTVLGVTSKTGSSLSPGNLTTDGVTLQTGSTFNASIGGSTPGSGAGHYSQDTVASGSVTIQPGVILNVVPSGYTPHANDEFVLIANNGGNPITGTFEAGLGINLPLGTPLTEGLIVSTNFLGSGLFATITYQAGAGHDSVGIMLQKDLTVSIGSPSRSITSTAAVTYTVTYTDVDSDFIASTLSIANVHLIATGDATGTLSFDASTGATRTITVTPTGGNGTLAIAIDAGSATDLGGNIPAASGTSTSFTLDTVPVGINISAPSKSITNTGPVTFTVTYSDSDFASSTLNASNVHLVSTSGATGTLNFGPGLGATRTVTIMNISGNGTLGISIDAGSGVDQAGNTSPAASSTTFTVDNVPVGISIGAPSKSITNTAGGDVTYTVTYTDTDFASSTLSSANVHLIETGGATGTLSFDSGSGATRTITVTPTGTGDGTLAISIDTGSASDDAGNTAPASGNSTAFTLDNTPVGISIGAPSKSITNTAGGAVTYTVTYTDTDFASSTLDASNVHLIETGGATGTLSFDSGSGATRTITVTPTGTGDGTLAISIDTGSASDDAGNTAPASGNSTAFTLDNTPVGISIGAPSKSITNTAGGAVTYTVTYTDTDFASSTLDLSNVHLIETGGATGTLSFDSGSGATRTITVTPTGTGDGTLAISIDTGSASDDAGNTAPASGTSTAFTLDNDPVGISIGAPSKSITNTAGGAVTYTVTYTDTDFASSTLTSANVHLVETGGATGTLSIGPGVGTTRTITVTPTGTGDGTLAISIDAGSGSDQAGNTSPAASGTAFTLDNTAVGISVGLPSRSITNTAGGAVTYTVTYTDTDFSSSTLDSSNVHLIETGSATGTLSFDSGSGATRTITVTPTGTGDGTLAIAIDAGSASDDAGNTAAASGTSTAFTLDNTPVGISIGSPSKSITNTAGGPITYTITYTDTDFASSTLTASNVHLITTGDATATLSFDPTIGATRTVTVTPTGGNGTLAISIDAGSASDQAGNTAPASGTSTAFTLDNVAPTISIGLPSRSITNTVGGAVTYTVTYMDDVAFGSSTLTASNVHLITTGSATGTLSFDAGTGATRTVTVTPTGGDGTLAIAIDAGSGMDQAGNVTAASGTSNAFVEDNTPPSISVSAPSVSITNTAGGAVTYTVTYTDLNFASSTLDLSNVHLIETGTATGTLSFDSSSGTTRTITVTPTGTGNGTLAISIDAGSASDQAGNTALPSGTSEAFTLDNTAVGISVGLPSKSIINTAGGPVTYTVTYTDTDFASSTLTASNVHLISTGSATGTLSFDASTGATRTITVTPTGTGNGTLAIAIDAGSASDQAGNTAPATGTSFSFLLDNTPPSSSVTIQNETTNGYSPGTFTISWANGSDNGGGDAITGYTVYVSHNGGTFTAIPSLTNTTQTSAVFNPTSVFLNAQSGDTYGFYSLATDQAGNTQTAPAAAQATTRVDTVAPTSTVTALPVLSQNTFTVSWTGADDTGGSGLAFFDVFVSDNSTTTFTKWQSQTTATSAVFDPTIVFPGANGAKLGDTFRFYTVATDNVGNVEATPAPEATTETPVFINMSLIVPENSTTPPNLSIKTLLSGQYTDPNTSNKPGIAVTFVGGNGTWQYSTNGTTWTSISGVSITNALLLPQTDKIRFVPAPDSVGTADLLFVGWDGTLGSAGQHANITMLGNGTPFSLQGGMIQVTVQAAANTPAPAWLATSTTFTPIVAGGGGTNTGQTVQSVFGGVFTSPRATQAAIAITAVTGAGTWQYQLASGGSFQNFPKVSASNALLLGPDDLIHFLPTANLTFVGAVTLTAHAWDGTGGFTDGGTTNLSRKGSTGGSTPFSSTLVSAKLYFNHAPTEMSPAGGINLGSINENTTSKTVTVTTLVKTDALATDPDKGAKVGMAITGVTGLGVWQYRLTSTSAWLTVPASVSATSALLLPSTAQLHFVPKADQTGTASLSWLAWDGTQGTAGQTFNASVTGGATAFSSNTATASLTITPATSPPAPAWVGTGALLTPVLPGSTATTITPSQVSTVFGPYFSDPSATTIGIAITGLSGTKSGTWKFSTDSGMTWTTMPAVSAKSALLLSGNDLIEFVPNASFTGTVTLTAHAWDGGGTGNSAGGTANLTLAHSTGGTSHFSATTLTATELVNNSPVLLGS